MKRPLLVGTPEIISMIPEEIQRMLDNEGLYIGSNPNDPTMGEAPLVSMGGKVYSLIVDKELDPTRFIEGHQLAGPFRAASPSIPVFEMGSRVPETSSPEDIAAAVADLAAKGIVDVLPSESGDPFDAKIQLTPKGRALGLSLNMPPEHPEKSESHTTKSKTEH